MLIKANLVIMYFEMEKLYTIFKKKKKISVFKHKKTKNIQEIAYSIF